jgi:D-galactarolactone cycloisomerase
MRVGQWFEQTPNPLHSALARKPIAQRGGTVRVPDGPGLGIEVDREVLARCMVA